MNVNAKRECKKTSPLLNTKEIRTTAELDALSLTDYVDANDRNWLRFIELTDAAEIYRFCSLCIGSTKYVFAIDEVCQRVLVILKH